MRTTGGFRVETDAGIEGWLEDRRGDDGGFVLHAGAGDGERELGRTSRLRGSGAVPTTVLLEDGRLFRIEVRGLSPARVELSSDQTPGAYFVARPVARGFEIETTVAGRALEGDPLADPEARRERLGGGEHDRQREGTAVLEPHS